MARTETQTVRQEGLPQAVSVLQTSRLATLLHKSTNLSLEKEMVFSPKLQIMIKQLTLRKVCLVGHGYIIT